MAAPPPAELLDKLSFVIHWSCVEIRQFIREGRFEQAVDLADIAEHVPGFLPSWKEEYLAIVIDSFQRYQAKYGNKVFDYVGYLSMDKASYQNHYGKWRSGD